MVCISCIDTFNLEVLTSLASVHCSAFSDLHRETDHAILTYLILGVLEVFLAKWKLQERSNTLENW